MSMQKAKHDALLTQEGGGGGSGASARGEREGGSGGRGGRARARERERGREGVRDRDRGREGERDGETERKRAPNLIQGAFVIFILLWNNPINIQLQFFHEADSNARMPLQFCLSR